MVATMSVAVMLPFLSRGEGIMTIRVRKGGVYDWDTPGPNLGKDAPKDFQRPVQTLKGALMADHKADARGRRYVRLHGVPVAVIRHKDTWRVFGEVFPDGVERFGKADGIRECVKAIASVL